MSPAAPPSPDPALLDFVQHELGLPVAAEVSAFAASLGARPRAVAVLFYGSCLQKGATDGLLDFYVLTEGSRPFGQSALSAWAGRRLPPNVYHETFSGLQAKVAVVDISLFRGRMAPEGSDTSFWARFCQRSALVWRRDETAGADAAAAVAAAVETGAIWAERLMDEPVQGAAAWRGLFSRTYGAELRVESAGRATDIVAADEARFDALWPLTAAARAAAPPIDADRAWAARRSAGKRRNVARLIKAAFTFKGGLDYAIWKVERHSGRPVELSPWQKRLPWLAAPFVFLRLLRDRRLR